MALRLYSKSFPALLLLCLCFQWLNAQIYKDHGKTRFTFAQSTIGYDLEFTPATGHGFRYQNGDLEKLTFGNTVTPVISITGLHFWGRAEFFTSISLPSWSLDKTQPFSFSRYAGTGFKFFVLPIRKKGLSPYVGSSIGAFAFKVDDAATLKRVEFPVLAGITYSFNHGLLEAGVNYYARNKYDYFVSKDVVAPLSTPHLAFVIDYKYFFDLSFRPSSAPNEGLAKGSDKGQQKLNSFFVAAGPAYSFLLSRSSYNTSMRPYLDDYKITSLFPDLGLGYYHYKRDAALNISYRGYSMELKGFDVQQSVKRRSFAFELYKFVGDYHGFVPFIGPLVSRERFGVKETQSGVTTIDNQYDFWAAGVIGGWDIRPRRIDWWGVRTNIRYFPGLNLKLTGSHSLALSQLEVNFLQLIIYPTRLMTTGG